MIRRPDGPLINAKGESFIAAQQDHIARYQIECHRLLALIGEHIADDGDPDAWAHECFVTDESRLGDFFYMFDGDKSIPAEILSGKLGFRVERDELMYEIAARMHGLQ